MTHAIKLETQARLEKIFRAVISKETNSEFSILTLQAKFPH